VAWHGSSYDAAANPQTAIGVDLLARLSLPVGGVVVDAGCGSGRVTEALLELRPDVTVVGLDASASMLAAARDRLARFGSRVDLRHADLAEPWPIGEPVDAVLSSSTFHWVLDHRRLFAAVFAALRPGGMLVARCGGAGSLRAVLERAASVGVGVEGRNTYATASVTAELLEGAGFVDVWTWLETDPVRFESIDALAGYLADAALAPYERGAECAADVAAGLPEPVVEFVRLNILARRPVDDGS
jgi:trans-aconitate 2-methyltransferase